MGGTVLDVTTTVALLNQTLSYTYPTIVVQGELSNFKVSKGRWVYADIKDDMSKLRLFGTIYQLKTALEDGMLVEVSAEPRLHPQFGFSLNIMSIKPVGEGAIKKSADLLAKKLEAEGLFALERKRLLPEYVQHIGVVGSSESAGYADFIKILGERWQGVEIDVYESQVQGEAAVEQLVAGLQYFSQCERTPEVVVMIRGGGSADDLSVFSTEPVVRAVAQSRVPTLVAIGHEVDTSLAELAADVRASTPSNAAEVLVPDREDQAKRLRLLIETLGDDIDRVLSEKLHNLERVSESLHHVVDRELETRTSVLDARLQQLKQSHPSQALKRGYAIATQNGKLLKSVKQLSSADVLSVQLHDGIVETKVERVQ